MDVKGGSVTGRYYTVIIVVYLIVYDNKEHGCYSVIVFIHNLTCTDGSPVIYRLLFVIHVPTLSPGYIPMLSRSYY